MMKSNLFFLFKLIAIVSPLPHSCEEKSHSSEYASCGNCYCIVDENSDDPNNSSSSCPSTKPQTTFSQGMIKTLSAHRPTNPYTLSCNPYEDEQCNTHPPQIMTNLGNEAVCAINYEDEDFAMPCSTYKLINYETKDKAIEDGSIVTHVGACGVCSTTQDLSVYMSHPDLTNAATKCVAVAILDHDLGIHCFVKLGLTEECSKIWIYNGYKTRQECRKICVQKTIKGECNNGPPPQCKLNNCLECDETQSGPIFKKVAGRTRRRSGLLSMIARPCSSIAKVAHDYPCLPMTRVEEEEWLSYLK